ncbi:MAG: glycosyltransferase family 39 protein [Chloroflexi bacterium]|nr:glycosyltransferase family 39 protein [Chloroflexota bacterium]
MQRNHDFYALFQQAIHKGLRRITPFSDNPLKGNAFNQFLRLRTWESLPLGRILPMLFFAIGLLYLYAAPHFEASDNDAHIGVVKWIAETGELPVQSAKHEKHYGHEASQPPLYYLLMSLFWSALQPSDFDDVFQRNPLVLAGDPERLGSRNMMFYRQPYPPDLEGTSLTLYVIRLLTLGMATVSVAAVYQSARTVMPEQPGFALLATALTAFNPMFLFISTSVSNDVLVTTFASLACWQALLMLRQGFQTRRSVALAVFIALATLSKLSGLVLAPVVALAGFWLLWRTGNRRGFLLLLVAIFAALTLITGWWFLRNISLYGELTGTGAMLDHFGRRTMSLPQLLLDEFEGLRISYWGLFGAFSILTHRLHYLLMDALSLIGVIGLFVFLAHNRRHGFLLSVVGFLTLYLAIGGAMLIWWTLQVTASTGRLLFPYVTSISILLALGLRALRIPALLVAAPMFAFCVAAPFLYIIPQYDHPPRLERLPESAADASVRWGDISLLGYELPAPARWTPGDEIPLTVYWQPLKATDAPHALFISLITADGEALATIDSFPGWGALPTTWWESAAIYRDEYILQIPPDANGFSDVQLHIGWYPFPDGADILPLLASGERIAAYTIPIGAFVDVDSQESLKADATNDGTVFGDAIRLNAWRFSDGHILELEWQLTREIAGDLRVFAIALAERYQPDAPFEIVAQADASPPAGLDFLNVGETFVTRHEFELAAGFAGDHSIYVGWYNEGIGQRLSAPYPANMLELPAVRFSAPGP